MFHPLSLLRFFPVLFDLRFFCSCFSNSFGPRLAIIDFRLLLIILSFDLTAPYPPRVTSRRRSTSWLRGSTASAIDAVGGNWYWQTFTMANVIAQTGRPALVLAPKLWRPSSATSCASSSPRTPLSTSFPTATTTNRRPTYRSATPTLPRRRRLTRRSTCCATRQRGRCSGNVM